MKLGGLVFEASLSANSDFWMSESFDLEATFLVVALLGALFLVTFFVLDFFVPAFMGILPFLVVKNLSSCSIYYNSLSGKYGC